MSENAPPANFRFEQLAEQLLQWFDQHGRHDLPWQHPRTPYRVWLSEVMLQQTQVATVIPYFERFVERFPDIATLASADIDEVLTLWAGLGYYARGRNLHRAAQQMVELHDSAMPADFEALQALPGVGRSTAAAIAAQAFGQRQPILDGNVKRVLARLALVEGWPGQTQVANELWRLSDLLTPADRCADYTQAIMDLGATVCRRTAPRCVDCPWQQHCKAYAVGRQQQLPSRKPKRSKPTKSTAMLLIRNDVGEVLLQRRDPTGIWGGLWSLPQATSHSAAETEISAAVKAGRIDWGGQTWRIRKALAPLKHEFSHYSLQIYVFDCESSKQTNGLVAEATEQQWCNLMYHEKWPGMPAPVMRIMQQLQNPDI